MVGIASQVVFGVARVKTTFDGESSHAPRTGHGTGFWLDSGKGLAFVTNRHNLDASLWAPPRSDLSLLDVQLEYRHCEEGAAFPDTRFFSVQNLSTALKMHATADCAAIIDPQVQKPSEFATPLSFRIKDIADEQFFREHVRIMDFASFIGFPGSGKDVWWDQRATHPIARLATIASLPDAPFVNDAIKTADVTLVSGMSFSGSSGSPIILHLKADTVWEQHRVKPRVLGIMSGHLQDRESLHPMFQHTGLSYFTRSTSILQLFDASPG
jgi:hypothetical protein